MITITNIRRTCSACPAQWEGITSNGYMIYIRYRWGYLSIRISPEPTEDIYQAVEGEEIFGYQNEDGYDGFMEYEELKEMALKFTKIKFPETDDYKILRIE